MRIFGKEVSEYLSAAGIFMVINFVLGVIELLMFKLEIVNFNRLNLFYIPGLALLIIFGVVMQRKDFNKRQAMVGGLLCLLAVIWLPPFIIPSLAMPLGARLISLGLMYLTNAALYLALILIGWLASSLLGRRGDIAERVKRPAKKKRK